MHGCVQSSGDCYSLRWHALIVRLRTTTLRWHHPGVSRLQGDFLNILPQIPLTFPQSPPYLLDPPPTDIPLVNSQKLQVSHV